MFNTDMILMQAFTTLSKSVISDLWSTRESTPTYDKVDNITDKNITVDSRGVQIFQFSRKLDTGDVGQDFVIPVDHEFTMCYAINHKQANFAEHQDRSIFQIKFNSVGPVTFGGVANTNGNGGSDPIQISYGVPDSKYLTHGIVLYICWFFFGFLMICSKRYWKTKYFGMHLLHVFLGYAMTIMTCVMSLLAIKWQNWTVKRNFHNILGVIVLGAILVAWSTGILTSICSKFSTPKPWTDKDNARKIGTFHAIFGRLLLLLGNFTSAIGVVAYCKKKIQND